MNFRHILNLFITFFLLTSCLTEIDESSQKNTNDSVDLTHPKSSKITYPFVNEFEEYVHETMIKTGIPGAAVAIVKDKEILLLKGYGVKAYGTSDSVDVHTVFRIASVSKGFASMLAGILFQEGLLKWDDHVQKYLPKFKLKDKTNSDQLTIKHILSHTSGLPLHTFTNMIEANVPYATLRDSLCTIRCVGQAGTIYAYQNVIYSLIGDISQVITQKPYESLLKEKIFLPLGMANTSATFEDLLLMKNIAQPHIRRRGGLFSVTENTHHYYTVAPAAGVNASISDMAQWLFALVGNREDVIQQKTLHDLYTPAIKTPKRRKYCYCNWSEFKEASYGLGWRILDYAGKTIIYHGGHVKGYRSEVAIYPQDKIGIAILVNASGELANKGVEAFLNQYLKYVAEQEHAKPDNQQLYKAHLQ